MMKTFTAHSTELKGRLVCRPCDQCRYARCVCATRRGNEGEGGGECGEQGSCVESLVCVVGCLCWSCGVAFGVVTRAVERLFGALANPQGIAVDESSGDASSGDVYVADTGNARVQAFSGEGVFRLMFGQDVNKTEVGMGGTPAEEDVCTALSGDECQAGVAGSGAGAFTTPGFVAVDNDASSPSFHDVYVADTSDGVVSKFTRKVCW